MQISICFAHNLYSDQDLVNEGEIVIQHTNTSPPENKNWRSLDPTSCTWNYFQDNWQDLYKLKEEMDTTEALMGYGNSAK